MNNEAAKLILQAYRSAGQDGKDPRFHEALEQVRRDPELARWFANEQALDARLGAKLNNSSRPPANLKAQLLAQRKIVRPVAWRQSVVRIALAACLALFASVAVLWLYTNRTNGFVARGDGFAGYHDTMADFTGHKLNRLDFKSAEVAEVRRWLAQADSHSDFLIPSGLRSRPSLGCRVLDWQGHKVTLICFELENRQVAHLLVVDRQVFEDAPTEAPVFRQAGDVGTVSWSQGGKAYLVVGKGRNPADLMKLL